MENIEQKSNEAFKCVGDEGLFPNHTDKDIWIAGYKEGFYDRPKPDIQAIAKDIYVQMNDKCHEESFTWTKEVYFTKLIESILTKHLK